MSLWAIPGPPLGGLLGPLDAMRSRLLRALAPIPAARRAIVAREPRVALVASLMLLSAFAFACSLPIAVIVVRFANPAMVKCGCSTKFGQRGSSPSARSAGQATRSA